MTSEDDPAAQEAAEPSPLAALTAVHEHGQQVRERELQTALQRLDDLDADQRVVIETLAERLVERVLEPPTTSLLAAGVDTDEAAAATALSLFGEDAAFDRSSACSRSQESTTEFARAQD